MSSVTRARVDVDVMIGVDTHEQFHAAAAIDPVTGGLLDTYTCTADLAGYRGIMEWAQQWGPKRAWAVEGTNSHGIGLTRALTGERVLEVDRPYRVPRRHGAKSDHIDALRAAREAVGHDRPAIPRAVDGPRAELDVMMTTRRMTVQQATDTERQLRDFALRAPHRLRQRFAGLTLTAQVAVAAALRPGTITDSLTRTYAAQLHTLALRARRLRAEESRLTAQIHDIVVAWRPDLLGQPGVGTIVAAQLLISWSHPGRIGSEAKFAMLAGVAPIPASSGKNHTNRLNRSGDRRLNNAIHTVALARSRHDPRTRTYIEKRTREGKTPRAIRRCLKRAITRELYKLLEHGLDKT